jgi:hypothetical protein
MRRLHANLNSFQVSFPVRRNNLRKGKNLDTGPRRNLVRYCNMLSFSPSPQESLRNCQFDGFPQASYAAFSASTFESVGWRQNYSSIVRGSILPSVTY